MMRARTIMATQHQIAVSDSVAVRRSRGGCTASSSTLGCHVHAHANRLSIGHNAVRWHDARTHCWAPRTNHSVADERREARNFFPRGHKRRREPLVFCREIFDFGLEGS